MSLIDLDERLLDIFSRSNLVYGPLVVECFDPHYLRSVSRASGPTHLLFLVLVVLNLVSGFQALGTLLAVGIMLYRRFVKEC